MSLDWLKGKGIGKPVDLERIAMFSSTRLEETSQLVPQEAGLSEGYETFKYLGILDTYGVDWSMEKAARDTLQNFFDGNNKTLDGVNVQVTQEGDDHVVRVSNHAEYDFRRLMHLGGTTKTDDPFAAGGFGEGAKIK